MARLKETLSSANKGLTITLPASYWYLQHFDLANLVSESKLLQKLYILILAAGEKC